MKALVAGAGIAGLATGIALRQAGYEVEIMERSTELSEIGAGLMIWPNGARSLQSLGVRINATGPADLFAQLAGPPADELSDRDDC